MTTPPPLVAWRNEIRDAEQLPPSAKLVAFVLSTHMDRNGGSCFPSLTLLARETGIHRATVCRALAKLEREGVLQRLRGGRGRPTRYVATSRTMRLPVVALCDQTSRTVRPEDVHEDVHNFSTRARAREEKKKRAPKARSEHLYLDKAGQ